METLLPFEKIKRERFVRKNAKTDPKFGLDPNYRSVEDLINYGVINVNKPRGPTSHQVSAYVKQILKIKKTGHSGTLDPKVTGVLPVALGRATRIVQTLLPSGKEYVCIMHVHKDIDPEKIREAMNSFVGKIKQLPPIKSSVKRQWRYRKIYYIDFENSSDFVFFMTYFLCSTLKIDITKTTSTLIAILQGTMMKNLLSYLKYMR